MQKIGLEWFYRFVQEPRRMWKRYLIGNLKFIIIIFKKQDFLNLKKIICFKTLLLHSFNNFK